ncbi:cytochrome P450 2G1-like [Pelobates cultripes]|uniref:Cytochrome P450 2G1-like n=1 Tax=Pelobates cultripes TaxID=61616 RepID=A0AAD1SZS8_PELCU|nr:cytochrome P450 2G1-like [Pelobates cultripes]
MDSSGLGSLIIILITCLFIYITWNATYRNRNLPPGPTPLPLIGNLLQIKWGQLANSLMKYRNQYGSIYTIYFGTRPVIILCGYETVKEALVDRGEEFAGRGRMPPIEKLTQGYASSSTRGITFINGERWRQMRTFTFKSLREFGFGKKTFEEKVQEEAKSVVEELKSLKGKPKDITRLFMDALSNVLFSIIFGNRYEYKDERFMKFLAVVEETFHIMSCPLGQLHTILPGVMDYIPGPHQQIPSISKELISFIRDRIKVHEKTLNPDAPRDFIDVFLIKMEKEKNDPNTEFIEMNLIMIIHNLFIAGAEAVTSTIRHGMLITLKYPEIQDKIHQEIDQIIGHDRIPNLKDRANMPYTEATIHEIQRFCDLAPFNVPHQTTKNTEFRGYFLPKGTEVYPLLYTVHRDPTKFATPYKFNPNHFLDENGKFKKNDAFMAFSAGKRICPGESLGRMELFLFFTTILQNFKLTSETQFTDADLIPKLCGFLNSPIHYELSFIQRSFKFTS